MPQVPKSRPFSRSLEAVAAGVGILIAAVGGYFLFCWLRGDMTLRGLQTITIKTNASLSLLLCGTALTLVAIPDAGPPRRRLAQVLSSLSLIIGSLTLFEHISGLDLGIDQLLAEEPPGAVGVTHPNRMGPPGALSFALGGASLLLLSRGRRPAIIAAQLKAILLCIVALLGMLGYLYDIKGLFGAARFTAIAWQTGVAIFLLGIGILFARPDQGLMAQVTSRDPGGAAIRRLLPFALLLPILLGWLRLKGERLGLYETVFGTSILVLALVVSFSLLAFHTGRQLTKAAEKERKAEEDVKFQRQLLHSIVDNMPAGIFLARGDDLRCILVNPQYEAFAPGKQMLGRTFDEIWPEIDLDQRLREVAVTGKPHHRVDERVFIARYPEAPLEERFFSWSCVRIPLPENAGWSVLVTAWETTERKRTETELREAWNLLNSVLEATDWNVLAVGPDLRVLIFNNAVKEEIYRLYRRELREGQHLDELFHDLPVERTRMTEVWARALRGEQFVLEQEFGDIEKSFFEARFTPIRDTEGNVVGATQISADVTARRRSEEALKESEAKYRSLFEATPDAILVTVPDGTIVSANPAAQALFRMSEKEICRRGRQGLIVEDDRLEPLLEERRRTGTCRGELNYLRKDGSTFVGDFVSVILPGGGRAFVIIRDVTDRVRMAEELHRAKDELEERVEERTRELSQALEDLKRETEERFRAVEELHRNEQMMLQQGRLAAMGELMENISHQWRQPLNVMGLLLQNLTLSYDHGRFSKELLEKNVERARQLIGHMSQTMDDFKSFLNPQREKASFDVREVVEKAVSMVKESLKEIEIVLAGAERPSALGYRNEYAQVIINILINARDAFRERGVANGAITVNIFSEQGRSVVTIADNAGGVSEEIIGRIFDSYFTTKAVDKGTGIGLFMSKTIIERNMGGSITVRNTGGGAEFRIEV